MTFGWRSCLTTFTSFLTSSFFIKKINQKRKGEKREEKETKEKEKEKRKTSKLSAIKEDC